MLDTVVNQIIKQEIQLLDKIEPLDVLAELIDNEFIEIGSSAVIYDKTEVIRWLASNDPSERIGTSFKAHPLAENIILLTYMSSIKDTPQAPDFYKKCGFTAEHVRENRKNPKLALTSFVKFFEEE